MGDDHLAQRGGCRKVSDSKYDFAHTAPGVNHWRMRPATPSIGSSRSAAPFSHATRGIPQTTEDASS
jgi:hypothetical protein